MYWVGEIFQTSDHEETALIFAMAAIGVVRWRSILRPDKNDQDGNANASITIPPPGGLVGPMGGVLCCKNSAWKYKVLSARVP